ncbi:hypothetical protein LG296_04595 [Ureibacillus chungkukjangi]|uniref:hypothetical protein n=1 Tax=Ureibacillus chungkukjangi TaxID=1202712 RepID=UPI00384D4B8A
MGIIVKEKGVYSGLLDSYNYDNYYGYEIDNGGSTGFPPYMAFSANQFAIGMPSSDWVWARIETPLVQNKPTPIYNFDNYDIGKTQTGNAFLRTINGTITTPAGKFSNVVHVEVKYFAKSVTTHYYFAPGYGLVKAVDSNKNLLFELRDYY